MKLLTRSAAAVLAAAALTGVGVSAASAAQGPINPRHTVTVSVQDDDMGTWADRSFTVDALSGHTLKVTEDGNGNFAFSIGGPNVATGTFVFSGTSNTGQDTWWDLTVTDNGATIANYEMQVPNSNTFQIS